MMFLSPSTAANPITYVTCLHDLGRGKADGRGIDEYLGWLVETAKLLPNLLVFTDIPQVENVVPPNVRIEHFNFSQFDLYESRKRISAICAEQVSREGSHDITVRVPDYAILQFGKLQLLDAATSLTASPFLAWVDAGLCRFAIGDSPILGGREKLVADMMEDSESFLEVDFYRNTHWGRLRYSEAGTFKKTFSGGMFIINRLSTATYRRIMVSKALSWIERGTWDNEQIGFNQVFHSHEISPLVLTQEGQPGTLFRFLQGKSGLRILRPGQKKYENLRAKG